MTYISVFNGRAIWPMTLGINTRTRRRDGARGRGEGGGRGRGVVSGIAFVYKCGPLTPDRQPTLADTGRNTDMCRTNDTSQTADTYRHRSEYRHVSGRRHLSDSVPTPTNTGQNTDITYVGQTVTPIRDHRQLSTLPTLPATVLFLVLLCPWREIRVALSV